MRVPGRYVYLVTGVFTYIDSIGKHDGHHLEPRIFPEGSSYGCFPHLFSKSVGARSRFRSPADFDHCSLHSAEAAITLSNLTEFRK